MADQAEIAALVGSTWWARALLATEGDKLGLILRSVISIHLRATLITREPPWLGPSAIVDDQGLVLSNLTTEIGVTPRIIAVCELEELVNNCRALCDSLRFTQLEAEALFQALRQWIAIDNRPQTEQAEDRIPLEYRRNET